MADAPVFVPRRLAIRLLAEAQKDGDKVRGVIGARGGEPVSVHPGSDRVAAGETLWARYRSHLALAHDAGGRELLIAVDTKGVLQLRCKDSEGERELKIRD